MIVTVAGKLIYFLLVFLMKRVDRKKVISSEKSSLLLAVVPARELFREADEMEPFDIQLEFDLT